MKKFMLLLVSLLTAGSIYADAFTVKVINNSHHYQMTIRYKVCNFAFKRQEGGCEDALIQEIKLDSKETGTHYTTIPIEDVYSFVKVTDVIERDKDGRVKAQGDFRLHVCNGYSDRAILLNDYDTPYVTCMSESLTKDGK